MQALGVVVAAGVGVPEVVLQVQGHRAAGGVDAQGEVGHPAGAAGDHVARLVQDDLRPLAIHRPRIHRVQPAAHVAAVQLQLVGRAAGAVGAVGTGELGLYRRGSQGRAGDAVALHAAQCRQAFVHHHAAQRRGFGIEGDLGTIIVDGDDQRLRTSGVTLVVGTLHCEGVEDLVDRTGLVRIGVVEGVVTQGIDPVVLALADLGHFQHAVLASNRAARGHVNPADDQAAYRDATHRVVTGIENQHPGCLLGSAGRVSAGLTASCVPAIKRRLGDHPTTGAVGDGQVRYRVDTYAYRQYRLRGIAIGVADGVVDRGHALEAGRRSEGQVACSIEADSATTAGQGGRHQSGGCVRAGDIIGQYIDHHRSVFRGQHAVVESLWGIVTNTDHQRSRRRYVAVAVDHADLEILHHLVGRTGGVGIGVVEGVAGEGEHPGAVGSDLQDAVLPLHHPAAGDIHPGAGDVLHLHGTDAVRRGNHQSSVTELGRAFGLAAAGQRRLVDEAALGEHLACRVGEILGADRRRGVDDAGQIGRRLLRVELQRPGRITDVRVHPPGGFAEQHERNPTAPRTTGSAAGRTGGGGRQAEGRVDARGDRLLHLLHVGQFLAAGGVVGAGRLHVDMARQQLVVQHHRAVAPHGQLAAVHQVDGDGSSGPGEQLLAGINPVTFAELPLAAVRRQREHLADNRPDDTDQLGHEPILPCDRRRRPSAVPDAGQRAVPHSTGEEVAVVRGRMRHPGK